MINLLCLFGKRLYNAKLSPARRHAIAAIGRRTDVRMVLSGPDWDGWENHKSLQENINHVMPDAQAILWYKPLGHNLAVPLHDSHAPKLLKIETFNEAWWPNQLAAKEVLKAGTTLVICHHANDVPQFAESKANGVEVAHIPHGAEISMFATASHPWSERDLDAVVTGCQNQKVYPLRYKWHSCLSRGAIKGKTLSYHHPGYWFRTVDQCESKVKDYAFVLGHTKIALVCSSIYRYPLAKYVEAAMAGALPVGDMPEQAPPEYKDFLDCVDPAASISTLSHHVNRLLESSDLPARAAQAQKIACEHFSMDVYAKRFVETVQEHLK